MLSQNSFIAIAGAALQWWSYEEVFWKYAADLQYNTHAEVGFQ